MAEDGRVRIEKFNGTDFAWWKMQIEALLGECDLDMVLEEKPDGMNKAAEAIWDSKNKKARGKITLALTRSVAFNIMKETTAHGMLTNVMESYVDSWVMDSGASFHAIHSSEAMVNLRKILKVTGMGDIDLKTSFGTTWSLQNVRVIPRLKTKLISVGQLDEHGLDVKFGGGKWNVIKGNLVIARGLKRGSLYMVPVTSEGVTNPVKTVNKVRLTESGKAKKVHFANVNLRVLGMTVECVRRSESGQGFRVSGSMGRVLSTVMKRRWVLRTKNPNVKISPGNSLLDLESGNGPRCISGSGGLCKPVETEAVAVTVTTGGWLQLGDITGVLACSWELEAWRT
ncbi:unnamed protein product [Cuscuta campestris]|uniref:Retrovirus-related Pol polyprotein from transposon TNT 1-94-like beta-barrel domain-containing protein n=1 Tax=Cuscuta campestris TaxID=132261 RepID=A0A484N6C0_9ASTE|nr:unnamed protein product [Cuscuta campestris]